MDVYRTVREGVPEKGMVAWERQLRPAELLAVSAHVGSLLGSDPPNAKAPQGDQVSRQQPGPATETTEATAEGEAAAAEPPDA
jgi:cytochrome c oxidase cbb3-type subunit 3